MTDSGGPVDLALQNASAAKTPADFLKSIKGKPVVVKLNSGVDYRGIIVNFLLLRSCSLLNFMAILFWISTEHHILLPARYPGLFGRIHEHCDGADRGK